MLNECAWRKKKKKKTDMNKNPWKDHTLNDKLYGLAYRQTDKQTLRQTEKTDTRRIDSMSRPFSPSEAVNMCYIAISIVVTE